MLVKHVLFNVQDVLVHQQIVLKLICVLQAIISTELQIVASQHVLQDIMQIQLHYIASNAQEVVHYAQQAT